MSGIGELDDVFEIWVKAIRYFSGEKIAKSIQDQMCEFFGLNGNLDLVVLYYTSLIIGA